jgi:hypothetical protein
MSMRLALAAAAAIAFASPAFAQAATQTPPQAEQPQRPLTPEEQTFQTQAEAFDVHMNGLLTQIRAILGDAATDGAQKTAAVDAALAQATPGINLFADQVTTFLTSQQAVVTDPQERAQLDEALAQGPASIRDIPQRLRASVAEAIAEAAAHQASGAAAPAPANGAVAGTIPQH